MEIIGNSTDQKAVLNIPTWLSRGTLDAIGQGTSPFPRDKNAPLTFPPAAFDVQFGTIQNDEHLLARKYNSMMSVLSRSFSECNLTCVVPRSDIFGRPSAQQIFIQAASKYIPTRILEWMTDHGSNPRLERARETKRAATEAAKELLREKAETLLAGKGSRDVFSLLGRTF